MMNYNWLINSARWEVSHIELDKYKLINLQWVLR